MPPLFDLHCDTATECLAFMGSVQRLARNRLQVSVHALKDAGALAQFFAFFLPPDEVLAQRGFSAGRWAYYEGVRETFLRELGENANDLRLARCVSDIEKNAAAKRVSALISIENGAVLEGELLRLDTLYRDGVRLITLTWNNENELAWSCAEPDPAKGLKPFGREVVARMNELGMLVDVSHLSDAGFYDVARLSRAPFLASHSCARELCPHRRNLTDDMLRIIGEHGGVAGVALFPPFLNAEPDRASLEDFLSHVAHMLDHAGVDAVALGSDFDGMDRAAEGFTYYDMPLIANALARRFGSAQAEKICSGNALRLLRDVLG